MTTLKQAGDGLAAALDRVRGLRVHRYPPESLSQFPCAFIYPRRGNVDIVTSGEGKYMPAWNADLISSRQDMARAAAEMEPYLEAAIEELLKDWTLGGVVDHLGTGEGLTFELVTYEYNRSPVFGYRLIVPMKYRKAYT